jgi:hypothetical protein
VLVTGEAYFIQIESMDPGDAAREQNSQLRPVLAGVDDVNLLIAALTPLDQQTESSLSNASVESFVTPRTVDAAMDRLLIKLIPALQQHLDTLVGRDLGRAANADLAKSITRLLRRLGSWALECPHCQEPAVLRYLPRDRPPYAVFRYEHSKRLRHGASKSLGPLRLVHARAEETQS